LLNIDITAIISNHKNAEKAAYEKKIPFYYCPVSSENKRQQESEAIKIIESTDAELLLLARYMQVLTSSFCEVFAGRLINIHHSFLPGFKGAKPYHQAYARGVKMIGATAHFVTPDLDEGPIIAQNVQPVDHAVTPEQMQILGQDIEAKTLARAALLYAQRRIFLHNNRTVIL
jgi:formyltetrahydrofolate deformylase